MTAPSLAPFGLRPSQEKILQFRGGKMGIAAVPGAGKTYVLSALAAHLIAQKLLEPHQEILIVTMSNSAVENFSTRIAAHLKSIGLLPRLGYRVRTLHGLAHDIVREKPEKVGLDERFTILDEFEAARILRDVAHQWLARHPEFIETYLGEVPRDEEENVRSKRFPQKVEELATAFIRSAKNLRLTPERLRQKLEEQPQHLPLVEMGCEIYAEYQRILNYRGSVDFDDLIRLALDLLESDEEYLKRLQNRWPFILEDEAQDSSRAQEQLLRLLVGDATPSSGRGWVRVGDPNQAIYETFTTADPNLLRNFIRYEADQRPTLHESGRSQPAIIALANRLIEWTQQEHPHPAVRDALQPPLIRPLPAEDPQANPPENPAGIYLYNKPYPPEQEVQVVVQSLRKWLKNNPDRTVAVLVPDNQRGSQVMDALKEAGLPAIELLRTTQTTRTAASLLCEVLKWLERPTSPVRLSEVYQKVWRREHEQEEVVKKAAKWLERCEVTDYLFPFPGNGTGKKSFARLDEPTQVELQEFRTVARRWQALTLLPIDQIILSLAADIFNTAAELALAHKIARALAQTAQAHPDWQLPELTGELRAITTNERRFRDLALEEGFNPDEHKGKVVVATIHKAKGLEWDRVYVMSVSNYDFPSAEDTDSYKAENWFIRDRLNLQAEMLEQLACLLNPQEYRVYEEGRATQRARIDYVRERLRLLYVAITRARRELILTWNTGKGKKPNRQAMPFTVLQSWFSEQYPTVVRERGR
ncbi:MAG: ATP-dependent helicase [Anaerolineales bacterium]